MVHDDTTKIKPVFSNADAKTIFLYRPRVDITLKAENKIVFYLVVL